jgi:hypothetical protein
VHVDCNSPVDYGRAFDVCHDLVEGAHDAILEAVADLVAAGFFRGQDGDAVLRCWALLITASARATYGVARLASSAPATSAAAKSRRARST